MKSINSIYEVSNPHSPMYIIKFSDETYVSLLGSTDDGVTYEIWGLEPSDVNLDAHNRTDRTVLRSVSSKNEFKNPSNKPSVSPEQINTLLSILED